MCEWWRYIKKTLKIRQNNIGAKKAAKNQPSYSDEENSEPKFNECDRKLDTTPGDCPSDSDATCILCEGIFPAGTIGETYVHVKCFQYRARAFEKYVGTENGAYKYDYCK